MKLRFLLFALTALAVITSSSAAESVQAVLDVGGVARLRQLAVIDQVDACVGLLADNLGHRHAHARGKGLWVDRYAFLLGVHHADEIIRTRQAACMGGQKTVAATLHGLNSLNEL